MTHGEVTRLLDAHRAGDPTALAQVWPLVYGQLRAIAQRQLDGRPATLSATALVHEVYLRLARDERLSPQNRGHFLGIAARAMRQVLVDAARARRAVKRGGGHAVETLDPDAVGVEAQAELILAVDEAIDAITRFDARLGRVAECRLFAGLSEEETAAVVGTSLRTTQREWQRARAWLQRHLDGEVTGS